MQGDPQKQQEEFVKKVIGNINKAYLKGDPFADFKEKYPSAPITELINFAYHLVGQKERKLFAYQFSKAISTLREEMPINLDPLIKLAAIGNFKLYVNATCTNALELAISAGMAWPELSFRWVYRIRTVLISSS